MPGTNHAWYWNCRQFPRVSEAMDPRKEPTSTTSLDQHNSLYPQESSNYPHWRASLYCKWRFSQKITTEHNAEIKRYWGSLAPLELSTLQLLYLWLRKHLRKRNGKSQNTRMSPRNDCINKTSTIAIWMDILWGKFVGCHPSTKNYSQLFTACRRRISLPQGWGLLLIAQCRVKTETIYTEQTHQVVFIYIYAHTNM